jgi:hypothetical protein
MAFRVPRRTFLSGIGAVTTSAAFPLLPDHSFLPSRQLPGTDRLSSPFKIAIINDEISQDFGHACEVASREFGMSWIELRGMWDKNLLRLDAKEIGEAKRILEKNQLRVTDIASPLFKADWPGAPKSKYSPQRDQFHADFTFDQQNEVLERSIELAKVFDTDRVRLFDFWRLEDPAPYRAAMNEKLRQAAEKAARKNILLVLENEPACNTATARSCQGPGRSNVAQSDAELGSGQRRRAWREAVSRRLRSSSQRPHRPLPLQRCRQKTRRHLRLGSHGPRHHRLGRPIQGAQTRRLPLGRKPGNALARCRHAGRIDATELGRHEERIAGCRCNLSRPKGIIVCSRDRQALGARRASNACRKNQRLTL